MIEKILALLETNFPGVRKDGLKQLANSINLTVTTEEEVTTIVGKLTAENVEKFITDWRREADAEIEKANKTREDNLRKKYDFVEKKEPPTEPTTEPSTPPAEPGNRGIDPTAIQKMITDAVKAATDPLNQQIASIQGTAVAATRKELLEKVFTDDIPKSYKSTIMDGFQNRTFESDEAFNEYLNKTKENVAAFRQELADNGLGGITKPILGTPGKDGVSSAVADYIKEREDTAAGKAPATGKELNI